MSMLDKIKKLDVLKKKYNKRHHRSNSNENSGCSVEQIELNQNY